ncbi:Surfeit locus protein 2 (SURF2 [Striga hermonthica]|uniref:Surfeit locus protein 2 (SURF2) n=1 Tax=Striga hermonthica TaxID=68872 RepID=A0A9N7MVP0_STRHE|nr:Surfeit locus protein 2 (SURF2 [Striga hermonthica]
MGKKRGEESPNPSELKEGHNLLGAPTFEQLENGRLKCVETGHELPPHARDSYADSKHCRLGLIDAALARNKPPLNMFKQDPAARKGLCIVEKENHRPNSRIHLYLENPSEI